MDPTTRLIVTFFCGMLGIHRFIDHKYATGILYLFTGGLFGIGWIYDVIRAVSGFLSAHRAVEQLSHIDSHQPVSQPSSVGSPAPLSSPAPAPKKPLDIVIPSNIDNAKLFYHYDAEKAKNVDYDAVMKMVSKKDWELEARLVDGVVWLTAKGAPVMQLESDFRANMLSDWIKRGDPYKIYIKNVNTETKEVLVYLAFYRTVESQMQGRESQVVKLTGTSGEERQGTIYLLNKDDELDIDSEYTNDGDVRYIVTTLGGDPVGRLPKSVQARLADETYEACYVDHVAYDEDRDRYIPYIRIYW